MTVGEAWTVLAGLAFIAVGLFLLFGPWSLVGLGAVLLIEALGSFFWRLHVAARQSD